MLPKTTAKAFTAIAVAAAADGAPLACWSASNPFATSHAPPPTTPRAAATQSMSESSRRPRLPQRAREAHQAYSLCGGLPRKRGDRRLLMIAGLELLVTLLVRPALLSRPPAG